MSHEQTNIEGHGAANPPPAPAGARPSLAQLLRESGIASQEEITEATDEATQTGSRVGEVLLRRGIVDEPGLARLLARQWALPFIPDEALAGSFAPSTRLSNEQARALGAYAVTADDGTTWIVLADPHAERLRRLEAMRSAGMPLAIVTATALSQLVNAATLEPATESVATGPTATGTAPRQGPEAVTVAALLEQIMAPLSAAVEASRQETALAEARENELDELANQLAEITEALAQERARSASLEQSLRTHDQQHAAIRAKFEELETLLSSG